MTQLQIQAQIDSITDQLIKKYKPQKIFLFGSSIAGKMTPDSDLDFLIIKDDKKIFHDRVAEVYGLVKKDIAADFIVVTPEEFNKRLQLGDPFFKSIALEGRVLYGG
ncbi:MAG: nucleotidyltransferase domain-containing protein [Candidatus Daviesbacteria bacterium]|nr:nucleotidyltransferase domain-containing protein [Candidatus Daviesbacteria bacterium]